MRYYIKLKLYVNPSLPLFYAESVKEETNMPPLNPYECACPLQGL